MLVSVLFYHFYIMISVLIHYQHYVIISYAII